MDLETAPDDVVWQLEVPQMSVTFIGDIFTIDEGIVFIKINTLSMWRPFFHLHNPLFIMINMITF